jgi:sigma-B regulation protein RsbU (phosphoserine phosphatase)
MRSTMHLLATLPILLVSAVAAGAGAASLPPPTAVPVQLDGMPPAITPFNSGWLYHSGDDLAWASPNSPDDGWQPVTLDKKTAANSDAWQWYRIRLQLPATHPPLALFLLPQNSGAVEAYVNGQRIPGLDFRSIFASTSGLGAAVPLPDSAGPVLVALRVHYPPQLSWYWKRRISASLGSRQAVQERVQAQRITAIVRTLPSAAINLALVLAGIAALLLFRAQSSSREYLWLGLYLLMVGTSFGPYAVVHAGLLPGAVNVFYCDPIIYVFAAVQIEFTFAFVHRKVNRFWRLYQILLLACLLCTVLFIANILETNVYFLIESLAVIPPAVAMPVLLFWWYRRGNPEAGWLILPSLFPALGVAITNIGPITDPFHLNFPALPVPFQLWGVAPIYIFDLADGVFLLAIGIVIFVRFTRVSRQQAIAAAEFEAARAVQQVLVPVEDPAIPGFLIEGLYLPAGQVGGDFYQVIATPDGGVLAVVGDVSGKGMPAAMTVSLLVGTFRTLAHYTQSPAEILNAMNQRMISRLHGGFTTCLVLRIDRDGTITAANAGHIPPCMDGREQTLDYGLPLGLVEDAAYIENTLTLRAGAQLTLVTDGVPEARNTEGELFGFDRAAGISRESASNIAFAAQRFGQEDDITVLTLVLAPVTAMAS